MEKTFLHTLGIPLLCKAYADYDGIATLFSSEFGIVRIFVKGYYRPKGRHGGLLSPLVEGEYILNRGKGELWYLWEGKLLKQHLGLRHSLPALETSLKMAKLLLENLLPEKASPQLYHLFSHYLSFLEKNPSPHLYCHFLLKLLFHEGLINLNEGTPLLAETASFSIEEELLIKHFTKLRSLQVVSQNPLSEPLEQKVLSLLSHMSD